MTSQLLGAPNSPAVHEADRLDNWALSRPQPEAAGPALADAVGRGLLDLPLPGSGRTWDRWWVLASAASHDLSFARLAEGHTDALAILAEAGVVAPNGAATLGVWAAGPVGAVQAEPHGRQWRLTGRRRWCSGASSLTHALVGAELSGERQLFLVDLSDPGISRDPDSWPAVGMAASDTLDVTFDGVLVGGCHRVGDANFYVDRPGFWHGSAGVAACWFGGARAVLGALERSPTAENPHTDAHLGAAASRLWSMELALRQAAGAIDDDPTDAEGAARTLALAVRHLVETGVLEVVERVGRATGAEPLGHDRRHGQRVADLLVYVRQIHAESDLAELGRAVRPRLARICHP